MVGRAPITGHLGPGICEKGSTFVASKPERSDSAALVLLAVMAFIVGRPTDAAAKSQWKRQWNCAPLQVAINSSQACSKTEVMHVSNEGEVFWHSFQVTCLIHPYTTFLLMDLQD